MHGRIAFEQHGATSGSPAHWRGGQSAGGIAGTTYGCMAFSLRQQKEAHMRGILAWVIGIPIPIIILLYLFDVF